MTGPIRLGVALDGAGWHPAAWRHPAARPDGIFSAAYWVDLVNTAAAGDLDFVGFEDSPGLQSTRLDGPDGRTDQVRGRLDAVLLAARVAPVTEGIGLIPTATPTHLEPFHLATALATLDFVSSGRAGWRPQISARHSDAALFGRREVPELTGYDENLQERLTDLLDEAADAVEVVRRLWDSWEDDAEIRDVATGRFVDRDKLHYIDFVGQWFSVKGPSITPRPPQGQPVIAALAHSTPIYEFAARTSDLVYVTPRDPDDARRILAEVDAAQRAVGRTGPPLRVFADVLVHLDAADGTGADRRARLDELDGAEHRSDAATFTGSAEQLADLLVDYWSAGVTGVRLRPAVLPLDLDSIVDFLVPELRRLGVYRAGDNGYTLRGRLGLEKPKNRYAEAR
ncbi:LLM class flavin-dependent oxidoreductase [Virgisporangium aurantiacum]|uniref:FMNH2-utilizing oxygenase n=1 Tax=Virgisporangium aurantiacum TaxID=175570 RepID=A0A8J3Z6V4_9ACTN|nr:LLM class flavin-dependent oxidoreductase [Virgisporangium aurantiacum]GIJ58579.1 FMNH2-utilizing oxygenase [Virgisporangium aurantiacum]